MVYRSKSILGTLVLCFSLEHIAVQTVQCLYLIGVSHGYRFSKSVVL